MSRKVYLNEAQFRNYVRYKLHEGEKKGGKTIHFSEDQMKYIFAHELMGPAMESEPGEEVEEIGMIVVPEVDIK